MKNKLIFSLFLILPTLIFGQYKQEYIQPFPKKEMNVFFKNCYEQVKQKGEYIMPLTAKNSSSNEGVRALEKWNTSGKTIHFPSLLQTKNIETNDTLWVVDTLIITGNYFHDGPIIIANSGQLKFFKANATIMGDIILWGANPKLIADSSTLYFPQQYIYNRGIASYIHGYIKISNSTLNYSGLSHSVAVCDSSVYELTNVHNNGFTTNGLYGKAKIIIDVTNQAGEYVITDSSTVDIKNAATILLWHHLPQGSVFNKTFPDGAQVSNYTFNNTTLGASGLKYNIKLQNCTDVMWALMPAAGSSATITDSKVRAIGLWYQGNDTLSVSGLVNNSTYNDFTTPLSDRMLRFVNCTVQTYSIYIYNKKNINLSGCIFGELGTMGKSRANCMNSMCDGSGGYLWATDTSFVLAGFTSASTNVRSERNGILLYAYSALTGGIASATGTSVLMSIQNSLPQDPVAYDNACVWLANIAQPATAYADTICPIIGSAWIDKTAISPLMDFAYYCLYYQKNGDTIWNLIDSVAAQEVRNGLLASWNTHGLVPDSYVLKLKLVDNWNNGAEGVKSINLLPGWMKISENTDDLNDAFVLSGSNKFPSTLKIKSARSQKVKISLINSEGKVLKSFNSHILQGLNDIKIDCSTFDSGIYNCCVIFESSIKTSRFAIIK